MRKHFLAVLIVMLAAGLMAPMARAQGGMLAGKVLDKETGAPIVGASVVMENPAGNPARLAQETDREGGFTLLGLNSGSWTVTAEADGYHPQPGRMNIRQGRNPSINIEMDRIKHPLELQLGAEAVAGVDIEAIGAELDAADAAYENEQWDTALTGFQSVSAQLPMLTDVQLKIGNTLQQLERYEEAIAVFEAIAEANPQARGAVDNAIARMRIAMGDLSAAETLASSGAASKEDLYNLGEVEFAKGEVDAAAGWYEKAVAADPNWALPLYKLALVALNKGDIEGAKGYFTQVVEKAPDSTEGAQAQAVLGQLP